MIRDGKVIEEDAPAPTGERIEGWVNCGSVSFDGHGEREGIYYGFTTWEKYINLRRATLLIHAPSDGEPGR